MKFICRDVDHLIHTCEELGMALDAGAVAVLDQEAACLRDLLR